MLLQNISKNIDKIEKYINTNVDFNFVSNELYYYSNSRPLYDGRQPVAYKIYKQDECEIDLDSKTINIPLYVYEIYDTYYDEQTQLDYDIIFNFSNRRLNITIEDIYDSREYIDLVTFSDTYWFKKFSAMTSEQFLTYLLTKCDDKFNESKFI